MKLYKSCPSRGTWIEISFAARCDAKESSRAPRGARGLKFFGLHLDDLHF